MTFEAEKIEFAFLMPDPVCKEKLKSPKRPGKILDETAKIANLNIRRGCGGTGRRAGFRCLWA